MADVFCDEDQEPWIQQLCGSELGGIIAIALIKPGSPNPAVDQLQDPAWWDAQINASPQTAWVIKDTRGSKAPGTPVEEEGFGLVPTERTGDDNELVYEALGIMKNRNFVAVSNKKRNWKLVYVTAGFGQSEGSSPEVEGYEAFFVTNVSNYMSENIEQSIKSRKRWSGSAKWSTDMTPALPFYAPAEIFAN